MFSGHSISRVTPSTSLTWGRVVWKSKNSSPSKPPKRRASHEVAMAPTATLAASAASFQPVKPAMRTGRSSSGFQSMVMCLISMGLAYHAASADPKGQSSYKRAIQVQSKFQAPQVLSFGDLTRPQPCEVRVLDLAVQELVTPLPQAPYQVDEADFGGIPLAGEHRLAHKGSTQGDTVESPDEFARIIGFDAVCLAGVVQSDVCFDDLGADPGLLPVGARPYHTIEVLIDTHLEGLLADHEPQRLHSVHRTTP